jgi:hypothetical protein
MPLAEPIAVVVARERGARLLFAAPHESGNGPALPSRLSLVMSASWGEAAILVRDRVDYPWPEGVMPGRYWITSSAVANSVSS